MHVHTKIRTARFHYYKNVANSAHFKQKLLQLFELLYIIYFLCRFCHFSIMITAYTMGLYVSAAELICYYLNQAAAFIISVALFRHVFCTFLSQR